MTVMIPPQKKSFQEKGLKSVKLLPRNSTSSQKKAKEYLQEILVYEYIHLTR